MSATYHQPVLLKEVIKQLKVQPNFQGIDCTLGGGGHAAALLQSTSPHGRLLGMDWDKQAIKLAAAELQKYQTRTILVNETYTKIKKIAYEHNFSKVNYILCDLGLSSYQLEDKQRGFSFQTRGKLDLRFSQQTKLTADEILNHWSAADLKEIFHKYGQESFSGLIAKKIIDFRTKEPITGELLRKICNQVYHGKFKSRSKKDPATKVWQALRIAVNEELANVQQFLPQALEILKTGGRLGIITFHSLEDKLVKEYFKQESKDCVCPSEFPICQCQHKALLKLVNQRVITASEEEVKQNPRARSAKLRVVEKI